jgi:hypothetical protein
MIYCLDMYACTTPRMEVKVEIEAEAVVEKEEEINAKIKEYSAGALGVQMQ